MVTVADEAARKIQSMLEDQGQLDYGLRMAVVGGGCSGYQYKLEFVDRADEADQVIEPNGVRVFVDAKSSLYLDGVILDYQDGLMGAGFKVENPNAQTTCGCGESFCA